MIIYDSFSFLSPFSRDLLGQRLFAEALLASLQSMALFEKISGVQEEISFVLCCLF